MEYGFLGSSDNTLVLVFVSGPGCVSPLHGDDTLDMLADQAQLQEADQALHAAKVVKVDRTVFCMLLLCLIIFACLVWFDHVLKSGIA